MTFSNELISRDEGLHRDFAIELYKMCPRLPHEDVYGIVQSAVDVEIEFVKETLPKKLEGMNEKSMIQYVQYIADHLLVSLGYAKLYDVSYPPLFSFMNSISLNGKTNFFERRVSEYSKANVGVNTSDFNLDDQF